MRDEQMPASVTPESFPAHQRFVSRPTPKLSRSLEAALILPAGQFHRAAALRFAGTPGGSVSHPSWVALQILQFGFHGLTLFPPQPFGQCSQMVQQGGRRPRLSFWSSKANHARAWRMKNAPAVKPQ